MRHPVPPGAPVVVKVGSSSLTGPSGGLDYPAVERVVTQIVSLSRRGNPPVLVTSGAVAAGLPVLGMSERPKEISSLQVAAAIGQTKLVERYASLFRASGLVVAQVLLTKDVLGDRTQYLNARAALDRMLDLGVVPIVNENDTVIVDELKLGDNDQLAAITAHLVGAAMLVILTDTDGLFTLDPRLAENAELLDAVEHTDQILDQIRRTTSTGALGSGGVATKITAARMAAFSGIPTVVTSGASPEAVANAVEGRDGGTWVEPRRDSLPARKLWIAFALPTTGSLTVDPGALDAIRVHGRSLLAVGVTKVTGEFNRGEAVEVLDDAGAVVAKGVSRFTSQSFSNNDGTSSANGEAIHRDDLVVLT